MAKLTTLTVSEHNNNVRLSITTIVNVTKDGLFTTTLPKEEADKVQSYGIELPINKKGNRGYFSDSTLSCLENQIREVLKKCLSHRVVEEVPVIKYQIQTRCMFSKDSEGNIVPNPSREWTGSDNAIWKDGTCKLDALNASPFGFEIYARPFLRRVIEYGDGKQKVDYLKLNTEKGTYAHWLNSIASISYDRNQPMMEVECNEHTAKMFVDLITSICMISEQIEIFVSPERIKAMAESGSMLILLKNY